MDSGGKAFRSTIYPVTCSQIAIRAAQTGVFDLDIRVSNRPSIDVCTSFAAKTGLKSRNVEKRINARLRGPIALQRPFSGLYGSIVIASLGMKK
jgi:hypothetical protein